MKQWPRSLARVVSESVRSEVTESVADFRLPIVNFLKARPVLKIGNWQSEIGNTFGRFGRVKNSYCS